MLKCSSGAWLLSTHYTKKWFQSSYVRYIHMYVVGKTTEKGLRYYSTVKVAAEESIKEKAFEGD
jgi:hypothetical protein